MSTPHRFTLTVFVPDDPSEQTTVRIRCQACGGRPPTGRVLDHAAVCAEWNGMRSEYADELQWDY